jgi:hypothetical protein
MHIVTRLVASALALSISIASAEPVRWTSYRISETGASADIPASIFTKRAGKPDAYGQRFQSSDGSAELTVQSVLNEAGDSPASFLEKSILRRILSISGSPPAFLRLRASRATGFGTTGAISRFGSSTAY